MHFRRIVAYWLIVFTAWRAVVVVSENHINPTVLFSNGLIHTLTDFDVPPLYMYLKGSLRICEISFIDLWYAIIENLVSGNRAICMNKVMIAGFLRENVEKYCLD